MTGESLSPPPRPAAPTPRPQPAVTRFPASGRRVEQAYRELDIALYGSEEAKRMLGSPRLLARPWDLPSCVDPDLRAEVWDWLDAVVVWLNHEYVWDAASMVPDCWPRHPHLVHEIAVLADQRRRAGHGLTSDPMEEWHRYALPAFVDRMRARVRSHCEDRGHQPWPVHGRHTRYLALDSTRERREVFAGDVAAVAQILWPPEEPPPSHAVRPQLHLVDGVYVDVATGEWHE